MKLHPINHSLKSVNPGARDYNKGCVLAYSDLLKIQNSGNFGLILYDCRWGLWGKRGGGVRGERNGISLVFLLIYMLDEANLVMMSIPIVKTIVSVPVLQNLKKAVAK